MESVVLVRQGTKFSERYVELLTEMVREHAGRSLITLTDVETPGETRPLRTRLSGWWAKMELFAPWNHDLRPCLFLDLDTYILGDIRDVRGEGFWMLRDFNVANTSGSGVMILPKDTSEIWNAFERRWRDVLDDPRGDQAFVGQFPHRKLQDRFEGVVSYKNDAREKPRGRIVCFHGKPKPHESTGWARAVFDGRGTCPSGEILESEADG